MTAASGEKLRTHLAVGQRLRLSEFSPVVTVTGCFIGGFGEVYVFLEDGDTNSVYAAKTPRLDLSHIHEVVSQFEREAALWAELPHHPNILPAYDVRLYNGQPFVRMKYVPPHGRGGASLEALIAPAADGGRVIGTPNMLSFIAGQLLGVLADLEAHVPGFVHGDIKPANLLLDADPQTVQELGDPSARRLLLSDFGLAWSRAMLELGHPLATGDLQYLAPETFRGELGTKAQDVFAVGCTLFEVVTGSPYQEMTNEGRMAYASVSTAGLQSMRPDIPPALLSLILSCLDHDPRNRPASFAELRDSYRDVISRAGGMVREVKPLESHRRDPQWLAVASHDVVQE